LTNEEIQRAIEFSIQQQAEYAARFERDESRLARLEESFTVLVELARGTDERLDTTDQRLDILNEALATLSRTMNELVQKTMSNELRLARLEDSFTLLAKLAHKHE
jgi:hypothetical protein